MITNQQLVQKNFEEKIEMFIHAVEGKFSSDEAFSIANTGVPTDTFNILLIKSINIKNSSKVKQGLDCFMKKQYPFSVWMNAEHMNSNWNDILQKYNLKESERNVMMKLENTLHV